MGAKLTTLSWREFEAHLSRDGEVMFAASECLLSWRNRAGLLISLLGRLAVLGKKSFGFWLHCLIGHTMEGDESVLVCVTLVQEE